MVTQFNSGSSGGKNTKRVVKLAAVAACIAVAATILYQSFAVIPSGFTGVVTYFGAVSENVLGEGLHFKLPFITDVIKIDNRVKKLQTDFSSASRDLQTVTGVSTINYRLLAGRSNEIYRNFGRNIDSILIEPIIPECIKAVMAEYSAEELVTKRQEVSDLIKKTISEKTNPYGVSIEVFNLTDFNFSDEFNAAIEAKQTAQQQALKAEQDLERIKIEAEQKIEQAKAEAEAYRVKVQEITPEILQMEWINKWNGVLPKVTGENASIINVTDLAD